MNRTQVASLLVVSAVLSALSGCHCCRWWGCGSCSSSYAPVVAAAPPCNGCQSTYAVPPITAGPSYYQPPPLLAPPPRSQPSIITTPLPEPPSSSWKPSDRAPIVTEIPGDGTPKNGAKLMPPTEEKAPPKDLPPPEPPAFSSAIPRFNVVYDSVHAGEEPLADGFSWLKNNGYRTVVYLRTAGDDDSGTRAEIEAKGLKYISLEVGPKSLSRELVTEFGKIVRDTNGHPLFVYDKKGMPAGAMWYLHFRLNENATDADARGRATKLGLKDDAENTELWLAINKLLAGN